MTLRDSPLLHYDIFLQSPYREWMAMTRTYNECLRLAPALAGVPKPWVEWVERAVGSRERRGELIRKRLSYRLATLSQGVLLLQETKFICDQLENGLRQLIYLHCRKYDISWKMLRLCVPKYTQAEDRLKSELKIEIDINDSVSAYLLLHFTFYQTTELITRNWRHISDVNPRIAGFADAFWRVKKLRDSNYFKEDMRALRKIRNRIAHSNGLFGIDEVQDTFVRCDRWLSPLDFSVSARIIDYRKQRPRFLESVRF